MQKIILASTVLAASISGVFADLCANGQGLTQDTKGNSYCKPVQGLAFQNVGGSGNYQRVTNMDVDTGACQQAQQDYSGSLGPLADEVSVHLRGPVKLSRFAAYSGSAPYKHKHKRSGHKHLHRHRQNAKERRADSLKKRCGQYVTATYPDNGAVFSFQWTEDCNGAPPAAATEAPAAPAAANVAPAAVEAAPTSTPSPSPSPASSNAGFISGAWTRSGYYNAAAQEMDGVAFLNNMGNSALSGGWTAAMGNSLSYAAADGCAAASNSTILAADTLIPSISELVIMTDKECGGDTSADTGCGYYRPDAVAHHGFGGNQKAFFWEFTMPDVPADNSKWSGNMPALWLLNAQIPRTAQYGTAQCKAWPGAGELDVAEALDEGEMRLRATIHGNTGFNAGNNDYFERPTTTPMILGLVMMDSKVSIKVMDSFDFGAGSGPAAIDAVTRGTQAQSVGSKISLAEVY